MVVAWVPALDCVAEPPQVRGPGGSTSFRGGPAAQRAGGARDRGRTGRTAPTRRARTLWGCARARARVCIRGARRGRAEGRRGGGAAALRGGGVTGRRGAGQAAEPDGVLPSRGVERGRRAAKPLLPPQRAGRPALPPARLPPRKRPPLGSLSAPRPRPATFRPRPATFRPRPAPRAPCLGPGVRSAPRGRS